MEKTPKSLRLQLALFGRVNVGKSSVLNMIAGQQVAITAPSPGTTTDVVEKSMELLPIGPVTFLDTAGVDDATELGRLRTAKSDKIFDRADVAILVSEAGIWGDWEETIARKAAKKNIPVLVLVNKSDLLLPSEDYMAKLSARFPAVLACSASAPEGRERFMEELKLALSRINASRHSGPASILRDLVPPGKTAMLIIPIDKEAPKGRIILPQVQVLRDLLDNGSFALSVRESEYAAALASLREPPALVVCDSQVVDFMARHTPEGVPCTTFSILFARFKGDFEELLKGAQAVEKLRPGDRILIAEACSHHPIEDDIGRVKLPRWLNEKVGGALKIDTVSGRDFPSELSSYKAVIMCGSCMLTRTEVLNRIKQAASSGVPVTNYGLAISAAKGVLERVVRSFKKRA